MKLNKMQKQSIVRAILADIKQVDYHEQAQKVFYDEAVSQLPEVLRGKEYLSYLENERVRVYECYCLSGIVPNNKYVISEEVKAKILELRNLHVEQTSKKDELETKLHQTFYSFNTLKSAKEILPEELHKYLPKENAVTAGVPMVMANLMGDLKAMGFPTA